MLLRRLEQEDKVMMSLKMKLKMKEAEIKRLKKKQDIDSVDKGEYVDMNIQEIIKIETNVVKEEFQSEILKYRNQIEELELFKNKVYVMKNENHVNNNGVREEGNDTKSTEKSDMLWTNSNEITFQHDVLQSVSNALSAHNELMLKFDSVANDRFVEVCGLTIQEAKSLENRCLRAESRAEAAEVKLNELRLNLLSEQRRVTELESINTEQKRDYEKQLLLQQKQNLNLEERMEQIQYDLLLKEEKIESLNLTYDKMKDFISKEEFQVIELQFKEQLTVFMNDNTLLLCKMKELEQLIEEQKEVINNKDNMMKEMELSTNQLQLQHEEMTNSMRDEVNRFELKLKDNEDSIQNLQSLNENYRQDLITSKELVSELEGQVRSGEEVIRNNGNVIAQLQSQCDSTKDYVENLCVQVEVLESTKNEADRELKDYQLRVEALLSQVRCMFYSTKSTIIMCFLYVISLYMACTVSVSEL